MWRLADLAPRVPPREWLQSDEAASLRAVCGFFCAGQWAADARRDYRSHQCLGGGWEATNECLES